MILCEKIEKQVFIAFGKVVEKTAIKSIYQLSIFKERTSSPTQFQILGVPYFRYLYNKLELNVKWGRVIL